MQFLPKTLLSALALTVGFAASAQVTVSDDGSGTGNTTWTTGETYILDGFVFVNDGQTLTIEPGAIVKGQPGTGAEASALVVAQGGTIMAEGTSDNPIIFTFEGDPLDGSTAFDTRGQWGGLIVLGNAGLNSTPGTSQIEGIPETESRGVYGGTNDEDNSGVIRYVSIRHGGTDIGAGNEINGLTLGGVGSATTIEYVEVISNNDDGIEFFGGTVGVKHATVAFCKDDSFDYDEGWRGKGQFWFTVQQEGSFGDRGGEHDGGTDPETAQPYATPVIYNATYIGKGIDANKRAITMRDNAGGQYHNSVFYNWGRGIDIENLASGEDSYSRFQSGDLAFAGNVFDNVSDVGNPEGTDLFKITMGSGGWASPQDSIDQANNSSIAFAATFGLNGNSVQETGLAFEITENGGGINTGLLVNPLLELPAGAAPTDGWYDDVTYPGAFTTDCENNWLNGWTLLSERNFLGCLVIGVEETATTKLNIFPNPAADQFNISTQADWNNATLSVFDATGRMVVSRNNLSGSAGSTITVDMKNQTAGIYTVVVQNGNAVLRQKLIKQ